MARSARRFTQSPRRRKGWEEGPGGVALTTVAATSSAFLGAGILWLADGITIIRIRGRFAAFLGNAAAIGDGYQGAVGLALVTEQAFTAGIGSVPIPIAERDWDGWMYHMQFGVHSQTIQSSTVDGGASSAIDFVVDSKAMRKTGTQEVLMAVVEVTEIGTATVNMFFDSRVLVALP